MGGLIHRGGLRARISQQPVAFCALGQIAHPCKRQRRIGGGVRGGACCIGVDVREYRSHTLSRQRQRNRAADAVAGAGHDGSIALAVECLIE